MAADRPVPFVIVAAGRTGSTLLQLMLDSHPDAVAGGELFNNGYVERAGVPWPVAGAANDRELVALMSKDPVGYLNKLYDIASSRGCKAIGFKLKYSDGNANPVALDYLARDRNIRVIHLRRRNLLRWYVSSERAFETDQWARSADKTGGDPQPSIRIDVHTCLQRFLWLEKQQARFEELFREHPVLDVVYEELSDDPGGQAARCVRFLDLDPRPELQVRTRKTGTDSLRDAISNYDEVRAQLRRWASFVEE